MESDMRRYYAYLGMGILNTLWFFWPYAEGSAFESDAPRWIVASLIPVLTMLVMTFEVSRTPRDQVVRDAVFLLAHMPLMVLTNLVLTAAAVVGFFVFDVPLWDVMKVGALGALASVPYLVMNTRKLTGN
jgi:hypothetical protein